MFAHAPHGICRSTMAVSRARAGMPRATIRARARLQAGPAVRYAHSNSSAGSASSLGSGSGSGTHARDWAVALSGLSVGALGVVLWQTWTPAAPLQLDSRADADADTDAEAKAAKARHDLEKQGAIPITMKELGKHNTTDSLWVAIDGDVWDVTSFFENHPGGAQVIIDNAGKDVTALYTGIHPKGTLQLNLDESQRVGRLDERTIRENAALANVDKERVAAARAELFGVDTVVALDDFEKYAQPLLSRQAWEYYSFGADTEAGLRNNVSSYDRISFRPRVMRDVTEMDPSTSVLGVQSSLPVYATPVAQMGLGQDEGEVATTKAAANQGILQILSHAASRSLDEVMAAKAAGQQVGWQLYVKPDREQAALDVKRAVELGAHSIWLTVDRQVEPRNHRKLYNRLHNEPVRLKYMAIPLVEWARQGANHPLGAPKPARSISELMPLQIAPGTPLDRTPLTTRSAWHDTNLTWKDIEWVRSLAPGLPIVVKGVGAWEDVVLARQHGADAVVLSNHGGRQLDFVHSAIQTLHDVNKHAPELLGQRDFEIYVDGGIRRGTDVVKALCLGARAVGVGRPFIYAATAWGSEGIEKALMILRQEIDVAMRSLGVTRLDQLGPQFVDCSKL